MRVLTSNEVCLVSGGGFGLEEAKEFTLFTVAACIVCVWTYYLVDTTWTAFTEYKF